MLRRAIARGQMALPSFAAGGPFPLRAGRLVGPAPESAAERAAIATLYVAMMMAASLDLVNSSGDIILDGGLALNAALCATLAALRPGQSLYRNTNAEGTAMGAAALAFRALGHTSHISARHRQGRTLGAPRPRRLLRQLAGARLGPAVRSTRTGAPCCAGTAGLRPSLPLRRARPNARPRGSARAGGRRRLSERDVAAHGLLTFSSKVTLLQSPDDRLKT